MRLQLRSLDFYKCFVCLAAGALVFSAACRKTAVNAPDSKPPPTASATPQVPSGLPPGTVSVQNVQLTSALMNKNIPYRVVLPAGYKADDAKRFPVVYLLHGLTGHFNDWTDRGAVAQLAEKHDFIFVMPEGEDGWYTDSQLIPNSKFESYIVRELIPEIDRRFRTLSDRNHRVLAGLSMGGYGAIKFGLKFPEMFALVGSFSGALGTAAWTEHSGANQLIGKSIDMVFGPPSSAARAANDVFKLTRELPPDKQRITPYIYLSCGTEDRIMLPVNTQYDALLSERNLPHEFHTSKGGHDWDFWSQQLVLFLDLADQRINGKPAN
ncbi:MAG: esterase family protein [Acidobacteria bacterium]|nr:esterase family protein [Acidobacteriota bacterium]